MSAYCGDGPRKRKGGAPPYSANNCPGDIHRGPDRRDYISREFTRLGKPHYRWVLYKDGTTKKRKKATPKKRKKATPKKRKKVTTKKRKKRKKAAPKKRKKAATKKRKKATTKKSRRKRPLRKARSKA